MGAYTAMAPVVRRAVKELREREERWKLQVDDALEALKWCAFLEDESRMERLCAVVEKNAGLESPQVKQALSQIFNDSAAAPALRARAGECLLKTDWRKAKGDMIFAHAPPDEEDLASPSRSSLQHMLAAKNKNLQDVGFATVFGCGVLIKNAALARDIFETVAKDKTLPASVRDRAAKSGDELRAQQKNRAEKLVVELEKGPYHPRPHLIPAR